jgi:hypothetical protein
MGYLYWKNKKENRPVNLVKKRWFMKHPLGIKTTSLIKKADVVFSKFIRLTALSISGYIRCFTCGAFISYRESDNGHYIGREHMGTRYCEQNCAAQCHSCNRFAEGRKSDFAINLQKKYGPEILNKLEVIKERDRFITTSRLQEIIAYYKPLVKELEIKKLGRKL